jgi:hypothetical protein
MTDEAAAAKGELFVHILGLGCICEKESATARAGCCALRGAAAGGERSRKEEDGVKATFQQRMRFRVRRETIFEPFLFTDC